MPELPQLFTERLLSRPDATHLARVMKALSDPSRLQLLSILHAAGGEVIVSDLIDRLGILSQPSVSHHLALLLKAGLVTVRRDGIYMRYTWPRRASQRLRQHWVAVMAEPLITSHPWRAPTGGRINQQVAYGARGCAYLSCGRSLAEHALPATGPTCPCPVYDPEPGYGLLCGCDHASGKHKDHTGACTAVTS